MGKHSRRSNLRYYREGLSLAARLPGVNSYAKVGRTLGMSGQLAYYHCAVALGKLVYRLRLELGEEI